MEAEMANALTHGVGFVLFLILCPLLISLAVQTKDTGKIVGSCFFSFGLLAVFLSSTIYHATSYQAAKNILSYIDYLSIYFLISGSYTAYILVFFKNRLGLILLASIWLVSILGINLSVFSPNLPIIYTLILYLILGWAGLILIKPSMKKVSKRILTLLLLGGISYTAGTYFYYFDEFKYYHAVWHSFVLLGSLLHWIAIVLTIKTSED